MTMAGRTTPAAKAIPNGAPINVPICQRIFFFLLQGFFPQNVQPEGLENVKNSVNPLSANEPQGGSCSKAN